MTRLPSVCGIPNPFIAKFSPVLVLGIKLISGGLAWMSPANSVFNIYVFELLRKLLQFRPKFGVVSQRSCRSGWHRMGKSGTQIGNAFRKCKVVLGRKGER